MHAKCAVCSFDAAPPSRSSMSDTSESDLLNWCNDPFSADNADNSSRVAALREQGVLLQTFERPLVCARFVWLQRDDSAHGEAALHLVCVDERLFVSVWCWCDRRTLGLADGSVEYRWYRLLHNVALNADAAAAADTTTRAVAATVSVRSLKSVDADDVHNEWHVLGERVSGGGADAVPVASSEGAHVVVAWLAEDLTLHERFFALVDAMALLRRRLERRRHVRRRLERARAANQLRRAERGPRFEAAEVEEETDLEVRVFDDAETIRAKNKAKRNALLGVGDALSRRGRAMASDVLSKMRIGEAGGGGSADGSIDIDLGADLDLSEQSGDDGDDDEEEARLVDELGDDKEAVRFMWTAIANVAHNTALTSIRAQKDSFYVCRFASTVDTGIVSRAAAASSSSVRLDVLGGEGAGQDVFLLCVLSEFVQIRKFGSHAGEFSSSVARFDSVRRVAGADADVDVALSSCALRVSATTGALVALDARSGVVVEWKADSQWTYRCTLSDWRPCAPDTIVVRLVARACLVVMRAATQSSVQVQVDAYSLSDGRRLWATETPLRALPSTQPLCACGLSSSSSSSATPLLAWDASRLYDFSSVLGVSMADAPRQDDVVAFDEYLRAYPQQNPSLSVALAELQAESGDSDPHTLVDRLDAFLMAYSANSMSEDDRPGREAAARALWYHTPLNGRVHQSLAEYRRLLSGELHSVSATDGHEALLRWSALVLRDRSGMSDAAHSVLALSRDALESLCRQQPRRALALLSKEVFGDAEYWQSICAVPDASAERRCAPTFEENSDVPTTPNSLDATASDTFETYARFFLRHRQSIALDECVSDAHLALLCPQYGGDSEQLDAYSIAGGEYSAVTQRRSPLHPLLSIFGTLLMQVYPRAIGTFSEAVAARLRIVLNRSYTLDTHRGASGSKPSESVVGDAGAATTSRGDPTLLQEFSEAWNDRDLAAALASISPRASRRLRGSIPSPVLLRREEKNNSSNRDASGGGTQRSAEEILHSNIRSTVMTDVYVHLLQAVENRVDAVVGAKNEERRAGTQDEVAITSDESFRHLAYAFLLYRCARAADSVRHLFSHRLHRALVGGLLPICDETQRSSALNSLMSCLSRDVDVGTLHVSFWRTLLRDADAVSLMRVNHVTALNSELIVSDLKR